MSFSKYAKIAGIGILATGALASTAETIYNNSPGFMSSIACIADPRSCTYPYADDKQIKCLSRPIDCLDDKYLVLD